MASAAKQVFDRLGPGGLSRTMDDILDQGDLVKLANTCGVKYPGMRAQSQKRNRLLSDLVTRAEKNDAARKAILRVLQKETAQASRDWVGLAVDEKIRRLGDEEFLLAGGNLGLHLFLLATSTQSSELDGFGSLMAHQSLVRMATNGAGRSPATTKASREETRLKKKSIELEKKVRHLENQVTKARDEKKNFKRDLIQRKGELAEARMLVERLRSELAATKAAVEAGGPRSGSSAPDKVIADLTKAVRALTSEQKKLSHRFDKLPTRPPQSALATAVRPVSDAIKELRGEMARGWKEFGQDSKQHVQRIEELRSAVVSQGGATGKKPRASRRSRATGASARVGVFIDVQNMYYSARQLKGKLDFDALLEAAAQNRRLIHVTAYVVESKETNQSQFINRLEQGGIEVRRKTLQVRADGSMKGDWDMELALDILDAAAELDVVVLVSGDGDFTSLVKRVKVMGPQVEVLAFPRNTAKSLIQAADRFQPLDRKFMIYKRPTKTAKIARLPVTAGKATPDPVAKPAAVKTRSR